MSKTARSQTLPDDFLPALTRKLSAPKVIALALTGSHARGEDTRFSDVDILKFVGEDSKPPSRLLRPISYRGRLVTVTTTTIEAKQRQLTTVPQCAFYAVAGMRQAVILLDRDGSLAELKRVAREFKWASYTKEADDFCSQTLEGCAEEVRKIISGLVRNDWSAIMAGCLGMQLSLAAPVAVFKRLLIPTENAFYRELFAALGHDSRWTIYMKQTESIIPPPKGTDWHRFRGIAALNLYLETAKMFKPIIRPRHLPAIRAAIVAIGESGVMD